jgi:hypothetical protein
MCKALCWALGFHTRHLPSRVIPSTEVAGMQTTHGTQGEDCIAYYAEGLEG